MDWMIMPLTRYADFQGRSRRMEYWMFTLFLIIVTTLAVGIGLALTGVAGFFAPNQPPAAAMPIGLILWFGLIGVFYLAILVPSIAVQVRRFHDQDKSGWLVLLGFIPYIGGIIVFVFMCLEGTRGPNRYGPDPKNPGGDLGSVFR